MNELAGKKSPAAAAELARVLGEEARRLACDLAGPLHRISVRAGDASVELEWDHTIPRVELSASSLAPAAAEPAAGSAVEVDRWLVRSPMVGTFYHAPAPGEPPFVSVGGMVDTDTVIGIVEAMKLMNQICAERAGVVSEVLVPDGKPVEFGQPLLVLDLSPQPTDG